jgi:hypothetical protein
MNGYIKEYEADTSALPKKMVFACTVLHGACFPGYNRRASFFFMAGSAGCSTCHQQNDPGNPWLGRDENIHAPSRPGNPGIPS